MSLHLEAFEADHAALTASEAAEAGRPFDLDRDASDVVIPVQGLDTATTLTSEDTVAPTARSVFSYT